MPTIQDYAIASTVVRYNRGNRMLLAYQSRPRDMGHYPGVLVLHDVEGLGDSERGLTRWLAEHDYVGKAFDLYSRAEVPKAKKIESAADRLKWFAKLPDQRVLDDLERTWEVLRRLHWTYGRRLGVVGFGLGGYYALLLAGMVPDCAGCVAVSPRYCFEQEPPKKGDDLKPVKLDHALINAACDAMIVLPGADPELPAAEGERLLDVCDRQSITTIPVRYPEAGPRFWVEGDESYSAALTADLTSGLLTYFGQRL